MAMDKACLKIIIRRQLGFARQLSKGMPKPPLILEPSTIMVKAFAKTIALPKNGMAKPVI